MSMVRNILPLEIIASSSFVDVPISLRNGIGPIPRYVATLLRHEITGEPINLGEIAAHYIGPMASDSALSSSKMHLQSKASVAHVQKATKKLGFWKRCERRDAVKLLLRMGYLVRGDEVYYPTEIKINGKVVDRKEERVGRLFYDEHHNRANFLWEHNYRVERGLREVGYVSIFPVDKI